MKMTLADYVSDVGQAEAAKAIGVHQTAISKALRVGRAITINTLPNGKIEAVEARPFPAKKQVGDKQQDTETHA